MYVLCFVVLFCFGFVASNIKRSILLNVYVYMSQDYTNTEFVSCKIHSLPLYTWHLNNPAGTWPFYNVASTLTQRHDVASTLMRRCLNVVCQMGAY